MKGDFSLGSWVVQPNLNQIVRNGQTVRLEPKVIAVLACLAERGGDVVSKEQLIRAVWADTFVGDDVLIRAVSELRRALGDDSKTSQLIQTIPKRGYRLVAPVAGVGTKSEAKVVTERPKRVIRLGLLLTSVMAAIVVVFTLALLLSRGARIPQISGFTQLTHNRANKDYPLVTDGSRLYFTQEWPVQVSLTGGDPVPLRNAGKEAWVQDISPDLSELLVIQPIANEDFARGPVFSVPILGGLPRRIGNFDATSAAWSPDSKKLAYSDGNDLFITHSDGAATVKIWTAPGYVRRIRFSPDASRLRFEVYSAAANTRLLWQVSVDGTNARRVLADEKQQHYSELSGNWTADGKYYVFPLWHDGHSDLFALPESTGLVSGSPRAPVRLTAGPVDFHYVVPSHDNKRLFVLGEQWEIETEKFDGASKEFRPLFIEGYASTFSRDGKWMAFSDYNHIIWRSRIDGSEKLQLSVRPMMAHSGAQWSPDASRLAFSAVGPDGTNKAYLVSANGGTPERLTKDVNWEQQLPTWCSNGKFIVYGETPYPGLIPAGVHIVDVENRRESILADSQGFYYPQCSPDGRRIVAIAPTPRRFMLFDPTERRWSQLLNLDKEYDNWVWASDSNSIYFNTLDPDAAIYQVSIHDGHLKRVAELKGIPRSAYIGMTADGSPLIERKISSPQIYALEWK